MLKSKTLWLTNLTESNDSQEVKRLYENIWCFIQGYLINSDLDKELVKNTIDNLESTFAIQKAVDIPFGCCFCIEPDLINLWNEYGDEGKGVCLGFDLDWFPIKKQQPITSTNLDQSIGYEKVLYDSVEVRSSLADICYKVIRENGVTAWINGILSTFKHYASFIKNPTFKGEEEVRIVYYPYDKFDVAPKEIGLSDLCNDIKPHYSLSWCNTDSVALKRIIVGPECKYSEQEIGKMLEEFSIKPSENEVITISKSLSSYRKRS
ncbi:MAG: DUF2971 domain-containing protein [Ruminococcus sp.]|nr:DUF2971 domain-containing protein [Ruminococcus sp.]